MRIAAVTLKISLEANIPGEAIGKPAASVQREGRDNVIVLRIGVNMGVIDGDLQRVIVLRECC